MIKVIPTDHQYCPETRLNQYVELAKELESKVEGIGPIKVWYDDYSDFVRIDFDLEGNQYKIRGYKVLGVCCNSPDFQTDFTVPYDFALIDFFQRKQYRSYQWRNCTN